MSITLQYWFQTRAALIKALVWNEATISHQVTLQPGLVSHFCGREVKEIREIIFRDQMAIIKTSFSVLIMMMGGKCNFQSPFRGLAVVTCEGNAMSVHHFLSKTLFMHYIDGEAVLLGGCWRFITLCGYKVGLSPVSSLHLTHIIAEIIFLSLLINHVLLKHILQRKANANIGKAGTSKHSVFFLINYFFSRRKKIISLLTAPSRYICADVIKFFHSPFFALLCGST